MSTRVREAAAAATGEATPLTVPVSSGEGEKLSVVEKAGYGVGDAAANFIFQTMVIFQLAFYTDTFGISAAAAGTLFLVVRVFDAVFDPMMGVVADRTETRWGKFRPWVLWTAVPFGIMGYLTFYTPNLDASGKLVYAYVTYIVLMMVYSANNLPYSALSGVMTGDPGERTSLSSYRFVFAMLSQLVIQVLAPKMVTQFGHGDSARGYQLTMAVFSTLAVVFFVITFATTKERIRPAPEQKATVGQNFGDLTRNGPWLAMFVLTLILFITLALRGGVMVYYFKYFIGREDLFPTFNGFGTGATILAVIFSKPVAVRFGKRNTFIVGLFLTALLTLPFLFLPPSATTAIIVTEALRQFAYGFTIPLLWAMMADVADYSEWQNHRRATAIVFSAIVFALKAGLGFGGALGGYILSHYGYVPNVAQSERALDGIRYSASIFPAITFALCAVCLFFYRIDKKLELEIPHELAERRKQFTHTPVAVAP